MKVLVNTISTKKHAGGAFQISQNFLIKTLEPSDVEWYYITSEDVDVAIGDKFVNLKGTRYFAFPTQPDFRGSYRTVKKQLKQLVKRISPDVVYSITAPSYFSFSAPEVMRFTNPWVTHPNKYAWSVLSFKEKIFYFLYGLNQKRLIKRNSYFITQTETCAKGIEKITGVPTENIKVVNNVLPAIFQSIDNSHIAENEEFINIACVGAATTHKNFDIIPKFLFELKSRGHSNVRIHVTLPEDEPTLSMINKGLKKYNVTEMLKNHGRLSQNDLAFLYKKCDLCFLPTLLEVFSASTVEAMYFQLPTVATDFSFNTEVMEDSCLYYEPRNAKAAAIQVSRLINNIKLQSELKIKMKNRLKLYCDYDAHFKSIISFLSEVAEKEGFNKRSSIID